MAEKVINNFSTTVAIGGYTAGSGVLNVAATAGTVNGQIFTLGIYNQTTGAVITLFRVATVASGTQFTGAAEGTDTNASAGDIVVAIMSEAAFNGVCSDAYLNTSDITTNNVSTSKHGFAPKSPNDATKYLDGTGAYTVPAGGSATPGGSNTQLQYNNSGAFGGITGATTNGTAVTLTAPVLGTPASGTLTNCTGTASGLTSGITLALKSATTTVDVSAATAPSNTQVLTATSSTTATWQTPSGGGATSGAAFSPVNANQLVSNVNWQNQTVMALISGETLSAFPSTWKVRLRFSAGSPVIGGMKIKRTALNSNAGTSVVDTTTVQIGGNSSPTLTTPIYQDTDTISLALDNTHDYWFFIFFSNVGANASVGLANQLNAFSQVMNIFTAYASGDHTGDATIPALSTAGQTALLVSALVFP